MTDIVDLDQRLAALPTRPPARPADDIPARWRERRDLASYAACSRQASPDHDGTMLYTIESRVFPNPEQAHHARVYLRQKRATAGVDYVVVELREVVR